MKNKKIIIFLLRALLGWWIIPFLWIVGFPLFWLIGGVIESGNACVEFSKFMWNGVDTDE